jgi:hypothetical protein
MPKPKPLEEIIANWKARSVTLRQFKHPHDAELIDELLDEVCASTEDYRTFLSSRDAAVYAGRSEAWLRHRFEEWQRQGCARWNPMNLKERQYRQIVLPRHVDLPGIRADARRAARGEESAVA